MLLRRGLLGLGLSAGLLSCAPRAGVGERVAVMPTPAPPAPQIGAAFEPGSADPRQRQRLDEASSELDAHFQAKFAQERATAAMVGIVLGGELSYVRSFGVRDVEAGAPPDVDTVFRIASMTKSFTAAAVMKLRDEGRVRLDEAAETYLPELASFTPASSDSAKFTVRHLLSMAAGLPFDDMWGSVTFGMSEGEFSQFLRSGVKLVNPPGERYLYSNLGYALLGRLVARVSGLSFRDYVSRNLLAPLGMNATVWEARDVPSDRLATGYRREGDQLIVEPRPSDGVFDAAGGLYTSLRDYARYVALQLQAYPPRNAAELGPLRRSTLREMHQVHRFARWRGDRVPIAKRSTDGKLQLETSGYGFGWTNSTTCDYEGLVLHGGYEPGYFATVHLFPRHQVGVVVLATSAPLGWRSIDGTVTVLRKAGLFGPVLADVDSAALKRAQETMLRLIERWDDELMRREFDLKSQNYSWVQKLEQDFARLNREHGKCAPAGPVRPRSRTEGAFDLRCDRGEVEVSLLLAPGVPSSIQFASWKPKGKDAAEPGATCAE